MTLIICLTLGVALLIALALVLLLWRLSRTDVSVDDTAEAAWFSLENQRQMERLLDPEDFRFARALGCSQQRIRQLRRERRKIFRLYLVQAVREFNRTHHNLKLLLAVSASDRPDLAAALILQRLSFCRALAETHVRLGLHALGLETIPRVDVLAPLAVLRAELWQLAPLEGAAA